MDEQLINLEAVLQRLGKVRFQLRNKSCFFQTLEVEYLGHLPIRRNFTLQKKILELYLIRPLSQKYL